MGLRARLRGSFNCETALATNEAKVGGRMGWSVGRHASIAMPHRARRLCF
jgi:hypothetical protein